MTIAEDTYNKLTDIKNRIGGTYDDAVRKLIEMDKKYNIIEKTIEYEFLTETNSKVFRVTYGKGEPIVEYYNPKGWRDHISAWENYPAISKEDRELFIRFILKPTSFILLQEMGESIDNKEFIIRRVG